MRTTHTALLGTLAAVGMLLAGCGGGPDSETHPTASAPPSEPTLANFDPCTALTPAEQNHLGITEPAKPVEEQLGESGCDFYADDFLLRIIKSPGDDLEFWKEQRGNFAVFDPNQVNGREGIKTVTEASQEQGTCRQIMAAAKGSISSYVKYDADQIQGNDPCTKAKEIAETIEPRLPRATE